MEKPIPSPPSGVGRSPIGLPLKQPPCRGKEGSSISTNGINIYNEKSLHAALKQWYAAPDDQLEIRVDGYIIDLIQGDLLVEIQTGSFSPLKRKLTTLVETHPVRLIFPIPQEKWILMAVEGDHGPPRRRKSPKRGRLEHVFSELIYIPALMLNPNFSLEVLLISEEEVRQPVQKKHRRSKGWITTERRLLEVIDRRVFRSVDDIVALIPTALPESFTVRDLAKAMRQPVWLARKAIYCLRNMNAIKLVGKKGQAYLYSKTVLAA